MTIVVLDAAGLEILDEQRCRDLLGQVEVGRVSVTISALPAIFPVNYRFVDDKLLFFTGEGSKLSAALERAVVAFEVDQIDPVTRAGWSVQVLGVSGVSTSAADRAAAQLAELAAWAPAERPFLVAIRPERITGRQLPVNATARRHRSEG